MSIDSGTRLGPYEIVAPVGAGAMGEVYRARDTRLNRDVAIKILPASFAGNARLRTRFEREARVISSLSHPNICVVHDVGSAEVRNQEVRYLVMEFIDEERLSARIQKGPMPLDQILRIGSQIADALDKAHRQSIIHRDLKPANVMLTRSGAKLLDFGLAKHIDEKNLATPMEASAETERLPLTEEGSLLGTLAYMAPEQLAAVEADARTDIFSLGALLYEMATGKAAFDGESRMEVIRATLADDPVPIHEIRGDIPPALEHLILRCLAKEPDERWQSARDIRAQLDWIAQDAEPGGAAIGKPQRHLEGFAIAAAILIAALAIAGVMLRRKTSEAPAIVADLAPGAGQHYFAAGNSGGPAVISPDGRWVVYAARGEESPSLWVRSLETGKTRMLPGTEKASFPFWAPDSKRIAFFLNDRLQRMSLEDDVSVTLASAPNGRGGTWSAEGTILYTPDVQTGLFAIGEAGGTPKPVTAIGAGQSTHRWPSFLSDGRHFLFFAADHRDPSGNASGIYLASLDDPKPKLVLRNRSNGIAANGRLLFAKDGVLYAQTMTDGGVLTGDPAVITRDVMFDSDVWRSGFSVASNGRLVFHTGDPRIEAQLQWVDRSGAKTGEIGKPEKYWEIAIAPDGTRAALSAGDPLRQLWIEDFARKTRTRLTLDLPWTGGPIWSHDGGTLYFTALEGTKSILLRRRLSDGQQTELLRAEGLVWPGVLSADEKTLIISDQSAGDLLRLTIGSTSRPEPFINDRQAHEVTPVGTADGRWIAYASDESGHPEIYVVSPSNTTLKRQVSRNGGTQPLWRPDGGEIYYIDLTGHLIALPVTSSGNEIAFGEPRPLFRIITPTGMSTARAFAPSADGQQFLVIHPIEGDTAALRLVTKY